jgi:F-type H+-transporting ATPase subunit gamma
MPSLKEVKGRIVSVTSTQQITKAMKMVAAAKLRKSQERIMQMRPFAQKLNYLLQNLSAAGSDDQNWYNAAREEKKILIVAVSADRGLSGAFNSNIFKTTTRLIADKYSDQLKKGNVTILPIGRKANDYFAKRNYKVIDKYWNLFPGLSFEKVSVIVEFLMEVFRKGEIDRIDLVYNEFKNVATQILRTEQFLPVPPAEKKEGYNEVDYIYEPSREEIITGLIPKSLKVQLYKAVLDSDAAFNGAQMTAMDKATENAGDLLKELKLTYNRTRQAAITKEILEIVAGAEALKSA